jgi:hypothetical protein
MKLDFIKILILFLLASTIGFGLSWYFSGNETSKQKIKELEEEYSKLEIKKAEADAKILTLQKAYNKKDVEDKKMAIEVSNAKSDVIIAKKNLEKTKVELYILRNNIIKTRREIEEMKNNPKVLTDDELLEDLIKNTN